MEVRWTGRGWGRFGEAYLGFMGFFSIFLPPFPLLLPTLLIIIVIGFFFFLIIAKHDMGSQIHVKRPTTLN